jgi:hypothetical protein
MIKYLFQWGLCLAGLIALAGCDQGDDRLSEKASIEGAAQANVQLAAEKAVLVERSKEMEADLAVRQRFYQGVRGIYEGSFRAGSDEMKVRITFVPSLSPYTTDRVRQLEEVAADLVGLSLSAQIIQWTPGIPLSAVGCRVEGIKPDLARGEINIASTACSNIYLLRLSSEGGVASRTREEASRVSESISRNLLDGKESESIAIQGEIRPSQTADVYSFTAERKR